MKGLFIKNNKYKVARLFLACFFALALIFLLSSGSQAQNEKAFRLWSPAFENGQKIPSRFTCDGEDISPPLRWEGTPMYTSYFTLLVNDPDAPSGNWIHWKVLHIPGSFRELLPHVSVAALTKDGIRQGKNTWGTIGYRGPCPPGGSHRYFFTLKAFKKDGMELGEAVLMGVYR